jgi:hypothetical protein
MLRFFRSSLILPLILSLTCTLGFAVACNAPDLGTHDTAAVWGSADLTGSTPIVPAADGAAVYSVLADEGLVTRFDTATGAVSVLETGGAPSRITRWGDRLLVTLRGERTLLVLGDEAGTLRRQSRRAQRLGRAVWSGSSPAVRRKSRDRRSARRLRTTKLAGDASVREHALRGVRRGRNDAVV